jgi:hypothetical protein
VEVEDLEAGNLNTSFRLEAVHQAVSKEEAPALLRDVTIGTLLTSVRGAWDISDELNQLFPDLELTEAEEFLTNVWNGKP